MVVSVAHLAGRLEDSDERISVGPMGTPESMFKKGFTEHPWIRNLIAGKWIRVETAGTRDGCPGGKFVCACVRVCVCVCVCVHIYV